jgi:hypothetical protein
METEAEPQRLSVPCLELYRTCSSSNDGSGQPSMDGIQKQLDLARQATGIRIGHPSSRRGLLSTRPRASIEGAFVHLHTVDIMLTQLLPPEEIDARSPYVLARLRECLSQETSA